MLSVIFHYFIFHFFRILPKFLNIILFFILSQEFLCNFLYLGLKVRRQSEFSSCSWSLLSQSVLDHQVRSRRSRCINISNLTLFQSLYTVIGPLLAFLWMTTFLTIFTFLLVTYLDVKNWQGHDSKTAHYTLALVVILVPAIMTILSCTILRHGVNVYIPLFIPTQIW